MLRHCLGILVIFGALLPAIFAGHVFFNPARAYAPWAKAASSIAALVGIAWGVFGYAVEQRWFSAKYGYFELLALKHLCAGLVLGFVISISMARPYKKITSGGAKPDASR